MTSSKHGPERRKTSTRWVVDSGATIHCTGHRSMLDEEYANHPPVRIKVADNRIVNCCVVGSCTMYLKDTNGHKHAIVLHNVVYHPSFGDTNLLSVRRLWKHNRISAHFASSCYLKCRHTHAKFPITFTNHFTMQSVRKLELDHDVIHSRFGHMSDRRLRKLATRSLNCPFRSETYQHDRSSCDACNAGNTRRKPFAKNVPNKYTYFGECLSSDLCGPFPKGINGEKYLLNIVDKCTNVLEIYALPSKDSALVRLCFDDFLKRNSAYLSHGRPIRWHTDNGGEFMSTDLNEFCHEFAVTRSFSVPYAPPQNSHAERMWGIILQPLRTMLAESGIHDSFWVYAAMHACHLHNIMPSARLVGEISPFQAKHSMKPDVGKLRVWGCVCWYFLPEHERKSKVSPRAVPAVHLGMDAQRNGYVIYIPSLNRITTAHHVTFQERKFLDFTSEGVSKAPKAVKPLKDLSKLYKEIRDEHDEVDISPSPVVDANVDSNPAPTIEQPRCNDPRCTKPRHPDTEPHSYEEEIPARNRGRSPRLNHDMFRTVMILEDVSGQSLAFRVEDILSDVETPESYKQATSGRFADRWKESMNVEIEDLIKHDTWEVVDRNSIPDSRRVTKSKWV